MIRYLIVFLIFLGQEAIAENWRQSFSLESAKYPGNCVAVVNNLGRFDKPQSWKPAVEFTACQITNEDRAQRWFFQDNGQIQWAFDNRYCLSKKAASNPVLELCLEGKSEQAFTREPRNGIFLIRSAHGGCLASGVVDVGAINKVESSLCLKNLSRNHWLIEDREVLEEVAPFYLGRMDVRTADIAYNNPLTGRSLSVEDTRQLVKTLYMTRATNTHEIADALYLQSGEKKGEGFYLNNPYFPKFTSWDIPLPATRSAMINGETVINPEGYEEITEGYFQDAESTHWYQQRVVSRWFSQVTNEDVKHLEVCAIKFEEGSQTRYEMKTFASKVAAELAGFTVTHQYQCGACSTLKDLAVYLGVPNQTEPVRLCTKRSQSNWNNLDEVKSCIRKSVGFSKQCAEAWAYNGLHSAENNMQICLDTYGGLIDMVLLENFNACPPEVATDDPDLRFEMESNGCPLANENTGKLNACLWADERVSGPGFKYTAGRTRRGSGLPSAIPRPNDKLFYEADHTDYFK